MCDHKDDQEREFQMKMKFLNLLKEFRGPIRTDQRVPMTLRALQEAAGLQLVGLFNPVKS